MRPFPPIVLFIALVSFLACPCAIAQTLTLQPDGSLQLLFTKPLSSIVSVEQSRDLVSWAAAAATDEIVSQDSAYETRSATITIPSGATRLFLRLQIANAWTVALSWAPSLSQDVAGYCLYYGPTSHAYTSSLVVGNRVRAVVSMPLNTKTCYFMVTAYNAIGLQSRPSLELKVKLKTKKNGGRRGE